MHLRRERSRRLHRISVSVTRAAWFNSGWATVVEASGAECAGGSIRVPLRITEELIGGARTAGRKHICSRPCPPECTAHGGKCPLFCASDCTGHAASCPQRQGGWMFVRPKGKRKRAVPIPPELFEPLREHFASQDAERHAAGDAWEDWDLVWCGPQGQPIDPHDDWEEWKALLAEAGIAKDARLHDARHTAGILLGEQHVDIHVIQRILGHAQVTTTRIYTEPTDPLTREAAGLIGKALWPDAGKLQPQLQPEAGS